MSVHSNYYEDEEEYERDLYYEYRTENKPVIPFFLEVGDEWDELDSLDEEPDEE